MLQRCGKMNCDRCGKCCFFKDEYGSIRTCPFLRNSLDGRMSCAIYYKRNNGLIIYRSKDRKLTVFCNPKFKCKQ